MKKDDIGLLFNPRWADEDLYPITQESIRSQDKRLKEEHNKGKHEKYHIIQCQLCQEQYN